MENQVKLLLEKVINLTGSEDRVSLEKLFKEIYDLLLQLNYAYEVDSELISDKLYEELLVSFNSLCILLKKDFDKIIQDLGITIFMKYLSQEKVKKELPVEMNKLKKTTPEKLSTDYSYIMPKLDGISSLVDFENQEVFTKGNGNFGLLISSLLENIFYFIDPFVINTNNIKNFEDINIYSTDTSVKRLIKNHIVDLSEVRLVRGELILPKELIINKEFKKYSSARAFLNSLILTKKYSREQIEMLKSINFIAYEIIEPKYSTFNEQLFFLKKNGISTVDVFSFDKHNLLDFRSLFDILEENYKFDIDGLVFRGIESDKIIAVKYYADSFKVKIKNITWNVGNKSKLIPILHFDEVTIKNKTYSQCNAYNLEFIEKEKIFIGTTISLILKGEIPVVVSNSSDALKFDSSKINYDDSIIDPNIELIKSLRNFSVELNIPGYGLKTIKKKLDTLEITDQNLINFLWTHPTFFPSIQENVILERILISLYKGRKSQISKYFKTKDSKLILDIIEDYNKNIEKIEVIFNQKLNLIK